MRLRGARWRRCSESVEWSIDTPNLLVYISVRGTALVPTKRKPDTVIRSGFLHFPLPPPWPAACGPFPLRFGAYPHGPPQSGPFLPTIRSSGTRWNLRPRVVWQN